MTDMKSIITTKMICTIFNMKRKLPPFPKTPDFPEKYKI